MKFDRGRGSSIVKVDLAGKTSNCEGIGEDIDRPSDGSLRERHGCEWEMGNGKIFMGGFIDGGDEKLAEIVVDRALTESAVASTSQDTAYSAFCDT